MEQIEEDSSSWDEVKVTTIFTAASAAIFVTIFEVCRRSPSVSVVFDRRRASKPQRTPPPLLRNSIFEWLFLSNDPQYVEYADLAHMRDVIYERIRQRQMLSFRLSKAQDLVHPSQTRSTDEQFDSKSYQMDSVQEDYDKEWFGSHELHLDMGKPNESTTSSSKLSQAASQAYLRVKARTFLTPEVVEVGNRRLPTEIQKYALAGDLTSERLDFYAQNLLKQEEEDEIEFQRRRKDMINEMNQSSCFRTRCCKKDVEAQFEDDPIVFGARGNLNSEWLTLPSRISRLNYIGFQQGGIAEKKTKSSSSRTPTGVSKLNRLLSRMWSQSSGVGNGKPDSFSSTADASSNDLGYNEDIGFIKRHLKLTSVLEKRPLSVSDAETLRCTGLDTFVMIRFLRFCFDVTFYPFLMGCILLLPLYYSNKFDGVDTMNGDVFYSETGGYFRFTMNRLETSSKRLWMAFGFSVCFHIYILRRWIIEWETFLPLRLDFLANGDVDDEKIGMNNTFKSRGVTAPKDDTNLHLEQYRNSCIVEYIPESHRRDQELFQFFNAIFPNQVKRAEVLINASKLNSMIKKRQKYIELYEVYYAKDAHAKQQYNMRQNMESQKKCCGYGKLKEPREPIMVISGNRFCFGRQTDKAMPYLLREIETLNHSIKKEYRRIMEQKQRVEDSDYRPDLLQQNIAKGKEFLFGVSESFFSETGFVEFKNLTTKQYALQCNLTGNVVMKPSSAPDPSDIYWENAAVERKTIIAKNMQCDAILFTGALFWSGVVALFTAFSDFDSIAPYLPSWMVPKQPFAYDLMQGYLPVVLLEALMLVVPFILRIIAKNYIRFKTHSEIDIFIYRWHFGYRVMNLIIIIVKNQLFHTFDELRTNPQRAIDTLASGISLSSQFFLNNIIFAIGTEVMFELSQIPKMLYYFIVHQFITVEATSKRVLERLEKPLSLEWGEKIPPFIFALLVGKFASLPFVLVVMELPLTAPIAAIVGSFRSLATVYCTNVPIVTGVCAIFFYITTKVYTHQALFVYSQPYEGGGTLMYQLNRSVFTIIYVSVGIFSVLLSLKKLKYAGPSFFVVMSLLTLYLDYKVNKTFVKPSMTLSLTNARSIDEEVQLRTHHQHHSLESGHLRNRSRSKSTRSSPREQKQDFYLYRQPQLNTTLWETEPRPYHIY